MYKYDEDKDDDRCVFNITQFQRYAENFLRISIDINGLCMFSIRGYVNHVIRLVWIEITRKEILKVLKEHINKNEYDNVWRVILNVKSNFAAHDHQDESDFFMIRQNELDGVVREIIFRYVKSNPKYNNAKTGLILQRKNDLDWISENGKMDCYTLLDGLLLEFIDPFLVGYIITFSSEDLIKTYEHGSEPINGLLILNKYMSNIGKSIFTKYTSNIGKSTFADFDKKYTREIYSDTLGRIYCDLYPVRIYLNYNLPLIHTDLKSISLYGTCVPLDKNKYVKIP